MRPDAAQIRRSSLLEAVTNVVAGYLVALALQRAVFPLFGIHTTLVEDSLIAALFATASPARSFLLRRLFVHIDRQKELQRIRCRESLERRLATGRL